MSLLQPGGDRHSHKDQSGTPRLTSCPNGLSQPSPDLQADQRKCHAHQGDHRRRRKDVDVICAQGKPDRDVVDAEGRSENHDASRTGLGLPRPPVATPHRAHRGVDTRNAEHRSLALPPKSCATESPSRRPTRGIAASKTPKITTILKRR